MDLRANIGILDMNTNDCELGTVVVQIRIQQYLIRVRIYIQVKKYRYLPNNNCLEVV